MNTNQYLKVLKTNNIIKIYMEENKSLNPVSRKIHKSFYEGKI